MNSKRVLFFLNFLNNETNGFTDELAEIYKRALDEDDDIIHLKELLNEYNFYRQIGSSLYNTGSEILDKIYSSPSNSLELIPHVKQAHESIDNEAKIARKFMLSPYPFSNSISVLKKKDVIGYINALTSIARTCVYLIVLYAGIDPIKNITWNDVAGIQEMIYAVNTVFLPTLMKVRRPNNSWVIRKRRMGGRALFGGDCFYISYENTSSVAVLCSALHKEAIGTHAYLNVKAYESGECDVPFCWGIGNIVSISPNNAMQFLQSDIATKLRSPYQDELKRQLPTPFECVRILANGNKFCISPDDLLLAMNQWEMGHEFEKRKSTHNCLFCGKHVSGNDLVCSSHFTTELR